MLETPPLSLDAYYCRDPAIATSGSRSTGLMMTGSAAAHGRGLGVSKDVAMVAGQASRWRALPRGQKRSDSRVAAKRPALKPR